jgi:hypothetical protein
VDAAFWTGLDLATNLVDPVLLAITSMLPYVITVVVAMAVFRLIPRVIKRFVR